MAAKNPDVTDKTSRPGYVIYKFTTVGTGDWTVPKRGNAEILVVAGGGGGGRGIADNRGGGGGGAGGYIYDAEYVLSGTVTVTVGAGGSKSFFGGADGSSGSDSVLSDQTAIGGGKGGNAGTAGSSGGSGGGAGGSAGSPYPVGGSGTAGQGYKGGDQTDTNQPASSGGGSSGAGADNANTPIGPGTVNTITGSNVTYAAGGPGGDAFGPDGADGAANTGDGGQGGGRSANGGAGGSGIVIVVMKLGGGLFTFHG